VARPHARRTQKRNARPRAGRPERIAHPHAHCL
jgi:hypothetical protein